MHRAILKNSSYMKAIHNTVHAGLADMRKDACFCQQLQLIAGRSQICAATHNGNYICIFFFFGFFKIMNVSRF